jgi:hypothetical protein
VVAKRIKGMLVKAAEDTPPIEVQSDLLNAAAKAESPAAMEPEVMGATDRQAMKLQVLQKAIANGEVRPPSTPIPELPDAPRVNAAEAALDIEANGLASGSKGAQAMADEVRLAVEYGKADALNRWDQEEGLRDAFDYEARSFDEKKDLGAVEGWEGAMPPPTSKAGKDILKQVSDLEERIRFSRDERLPAATARGNTELADQLQEAIPKWEKNLADLKAKYGLEPEVMPTEVMGRKSSTPIADAFAEQMRGMAESDARLFRTIGEMQQVTRQAIDELSGVAPRPVRPEPLRLTQAIEQPGFTLPESLGRAAPRYGRATVRFQSDLDRAAYILANDAVKPSKSAPKFREAVEAAGLDVAEVVAHGKRVKAAIKQAAGGGAAPQKAMDLDIPAQPFGAAPKPPAKAGDIAVRQQIEANNQAMDDIRRKAQQEGC